MATAVLLDACGKYEIKQFYQVFTDEIFGVLKWKVNHVLEREKNMGSKQKSIVSDNFTIENNAISNHQPPLQVEVEKCPKGSVTASLKSGCRKHFYYTRAWGSMPCILMHGVS